MNFEEHRSGTYKEPFSHTEYGVFAISAKDGSVKFVATALDEEHALLRATNYYHDTDANDSEIDSFFVRARTVTYSPWDE